MWKWKERMKLRHHCLGTCCMPLHSRLHDKTVFRHLSLFSRDTCQQYIAIKVTKVIKIASLSPVTMTIMESMQCTFFIHQNVSHVISPASSFSRDSMFLWDACFFVKWVQESHVLSKRYLRTIKMSRMRARLSQSDLQLATCILSIFNWYMFFIFYSSSSSSSCTLIQCWWRVQWVQRKRITCTFDTTPHTGEHRVYNWAIRVIACVQSTEQQVVPSSFFS